MGKSDAPPQPDYEGAARAQGQENRNTALFNSKLLNPNLSNPYASQQTTFDPNTGQPIIQQSYSPELQGLFQGQLGNQGVAQGVYGTAAKNLLGGLGAPIDFSGLPAAPEPGKVNQDIVAAMMQRPMADYGRAKDTLGSNLASAGIPVGSKAYMAQNDLLGRQLTDAQTQANIAGVNAGNVAFNQGTAARQNALANQLTMREAPMRENLAAMQGVAPQAAVQNPFSLPSTAQQASAAPAPLYNAQQQAGQYQTDVYNSDQAQQGNMMSGLFGLGSAGILSGGLQGMGGSIFGGMGLSGMLGGGAGAGLAGAGVTDAAILSSAAPLALSDRRLKSAIRRIGTHALGIGIYVYTIFGRREIGVMAQEVLTVKPEAVVTLPSGYMAVYYGRL